MKRTAPPLRFTALLLALSGACAAPDTSDSNDDPSPAAGNSGTSTPVAGSGGTSTPVAGNTGTSTPVAGSGGTSTPVGGNTGSAGSTGSGMTGGSTGSTPAPMGACAATPPENLLSDFEGGTAKVAPVSGRAGSWFLYNDGTGMQTPVKVMNMPLPSEMPGACNSAYAFHMTGTNFKEFGAGVGTNLAPDTAAGARGPYDASGYTGIAFRAKSAKAGTQLRLTLADSNTAPEGGVCVDTMDRLNKKRCGDYFGFQVTVGAAWQDFVIPFKTMIQKGWGLPITAGVNAKQAYTVRLVVPGDAVKPVSFDIWIDDIRFVK